MKHWSDFLRVPLHCRSTVPLSLQHFCLDEFNFVEGLDEAKLFHNDESFDVFRFFAEECDSLQGFQIVVDSNNVCYLP